MLVKRWLILVVAATLMVSFFGGCAKAPPATQAPTSKPVPSPAPAPAPATPTLPPVPSPTRVPTPATPALKTWQLEYLQTPSGTASAVIGVGMSDIINKYNPRIKISMTAGAGSTDNLRKAAQREPNKVIFQNADTTFFDALEGLPPFDKKYPEQRCIAATLGNGCCFVTLDASIKTPQDWVGKKVNLFPKIWSMNRQAEETLKVWGIFDKCTVSNIAVVDGLAALADRLIHVTTVMSNETGKGMKWVPQAQMEELITAQKGRVYALPWDCKTLSEVAKRHNRNLRCEVAPAGSFGPGQTEPIEMFVIMSTMVACWAGADEELIYEITKTLCQNSARLKEYHPAGEYATPEVMLRGLPLRDQNDLHPGALRYYKEAGLWPRAAPPGCKT